MQNALRSAHGQSEEAATHARNETALGLLLVSCYVTVWLCVSKLEAKVNFEHLVRLSPSHLGCFFRHDSEVADQSKRTFSMSRSEPDRARRFMPILLALLRMSQGLCDSLRFSGFAGIMKHGIAPLWFTPSLFSGDVLWTMAASASDAIIILRSV